MLLGSLFTMMISSVVFIFGIIFAAGEKLVALGIILILVGFILLVASIIVLCGNKDAQPIVNSGSIY